MKHMLRLMILLSILFFASPALSFQWNIDPDHTEIRFEIEHILATVSGQFTDFKGDMVFDPAHPDTGRFDFTVNVKSINTNNGKRDTHLRSEDFFDSDKFQTMKFVSSKITRINNTLYSMQGMMTIKDVTQKLTLEFQFLGPKDHPFDAKKQVAGFKTEFVIPRLDYHVGNGKFLKMGVVGKDVAVTISMEALREK